MARSTTSRPKRCTARCLDGARCRRTPLLAQTAGEWLCATHAGTPNVGPRGALKAERRRLAAKELAGEGDRGVFVGDAPHAARAKEILAAAGIDDEELDGEDEDVDAHAKPLPSSTPSKRDIMKDIDLRSARGRHLALQRIAEAVTATKLTAKEADALRAIVSASRREIAVDDRDDKVLIQWEVVTSRAHVEELRLERERVENERAMRSIVS